jgi:carboxymethylenebutenolidase
VQVDRRGFVAACIAAGFAVTAEPILAQAIKTSMDGLEGGDVKIGDIPAYYAVPKGKGKRPVVMVVAEIWGNHEHIKDVVRRLAKAGYFAVSNEPYFRIGDLTTMTDIKQVIAAANKLSNMQAFEDLDAVYTWSTKHACADASSLGITGFCRGTTRRSMPASPGTARSCRSRRRCPPARRMSPTRSTGRCSAYTAALIRAFRSSTSSA